MRRIKVLSVAALFVALIAGPVNTAQSDVVAVRTFPADGTATASPDTQITVRGATIDQMESIGVVGAQSGVHTGTLVPHSDGGGVSFMPDEPFLPGERVVVSPNLTGASVATPSSFTVSRPAPQAIVPFTTVRPNETGWQSFTTRPDLKMPVITVKHPSQDTWSGQIMLTELFGPVGSGPFIADYAGNISWFKPLPQGVNAFNLHVSTLAGRRVLTWWEGTLGRGLGFGDFVVVDSAYREIARLRAGNGYSADLHEHILHKDSVFMLIYTPVRWNMSAAGGPVDAVVWDNIVQQVDVRTGAVMFEWHSLDNVGLDEAYVPIPEDPETPYDYFHANSIEVEPQGSLLVSARHTNAIYQIDGNTGAVMARIGGKKSSYLMAAGADFGYQHDARRLPNGNISLYDNASSGIATTSDRSSFLELWVDEANKTVLPVRRFSHPDKILAPSQGSSRRLDFGYTFVGWGHSPAFTEFDSQGRVVFDASFTPGSSYRAFRQPWVGIPATRPDVVLQRRGRDVTAYVSWNGDTRVTTWELLAGSSTRTLRRIARARRPGFETVVKGRTSATRFALRGRDARGRILVTTPLMTAR